MNLKSLLNKLFCFKSSFIAPISNQDLEHILSNYWSDDFKLNRISSDSFLLIANESLGTLTNEKMEQIDTIQLLCEWQQKENKVSFRFTTQARAKITWVFIGGFAFSFFLLFNNVSDGLLGMAFSVGGFYWFRYVYHHQYATMVKYFKRDLWKYLHFKQKGYDYFGQRKNINIG